MFQLHPKLAADTLAAGNFPLCELRLMNDASYPWFILVPRRPGLREIHELSPADRQELIEEIAAVSEWLSQRAGAEKINVGALGNLVPQLHIHVIARRAGDPAWPGPVWGCQPPTPYAPEAAEKLLSGLRKKPPRGWEKGE